MDLEHVGRILTRLRPLIRDNEIRRSRLERVLSAATDSPDSVRADVERMLTRIGVIVTEDVSATSEKPADDEAEPKPEDAEPTLGGEDSRVTVGIDEPSRLERSGEATIASKAENRIRAVEAARAALDEDLGSSPNRLLNRLLSAEQVVGLGLLMRGGAGAEPGDVRFGDLTGEAKAAADALFLHNQRLVHKLAQKYPATGMEYDDIVQFGCLGLIRAVEKFDPTAGFMFSTYATWWIRQSITRGIADHARLIRIPVHMVERLQKVWRTRDRLTEDGVPPGVHELALSTGYTDGQVREALKIGRFEPLSLDQPMTADGETTLGDLIDSEDERLNPTAHADYELLREQVQAVLDTLTTQEATVISLRLGFTNGIECTLDEVGKVYGVTRERIRQIQVKAMTKLRHPNRSRPLRAFLDTDLEGAVSEIAVDQLAPSRLTRYRCPHGHEFTVTFALEAEPPPTWTCRRCGSSADRATIASATSPNPAVWAY